MQPGLTVLMNGRSWVNMNTWAAEPELAEIWRRCSLWLVPTNFRTLNPVALVVVICKDLCHTDLTAKSHTGTTESRVKASKETRWP